MELSVSLLLMFLVPLLVVAGLAVYRMVVALQVLAGLIVVFLLYRVALWMMRSDKLVLNRLEATDARARVRIVDGYALTGSASDRVWTTVHQDADNYAPLHRSLNRKGGAQFTYSFWMFVGDGSKANVANRDILVRGDTTPYSWSKQVSVADPLALNARTGVTTTTSKSTGMLVKCPRIRFGATYDSFVVEFNTLHDPDAKVSITPYAATGGGDGTLRSNMLKLSANKWVLHTFTLEDHVAITDFEDGIVLRYFMNDTLYHTARVASALKQNGGDLYLLPTGSSRGVPLRDCKIGDVTYYNYAVGLDQVKDMFARGPPRKMSTDIAGTSGAGDPLFLSEYNRLDVYNT